MALEEKDLKKLWLYFSSLCLDLENTTQFVNHRECEYEEDNTIKTTNNKKTYSDSFLKILLSACSEFEVVSKLLCNQVDDTFDVNDRSKNISHISKIILDKFPRIVDCEIATDFDVFCPLKNWSINEDNKVAGLPWWDDYNSLKHSRFENLHKANLENSIGALASLYVIQLYLQMSVIGDLSIASSDGHYFMSDYTWQYFQTAPGDTLPDYKTAP